jgi:hypothetical protein
MNGPTNVIIGGKQWARVQQHPEGEGDRHHEREAQVHDHARVALAAPQKPEQRERDGAARRGDPVERQERRPPWVGRIHDVERDVAERGTHDPQDARHQGHDLEPVRGLAEQVCRHPAGARDAGERRGAVAEPADHALALGHEDGVGHLVGG